MINSVQCKMARVALDWNAAKLAEAAQVGTATVTRFESGSVAPIPATLAAIQRALEAAGVEFIAENGGGPGVRLRKPGQAPKHEQREVAPGDEVRSGPQAIDRPAEETND
jgi:transcriptional regulator with XRE-family HTH domain